MNVKFFNALKEYDRQYIYIFNKVHSTDTRDINRILFFKMMQVIFNDIPHISYAIKEGFVENIDTYRYDLTKAYHVKKSIIDHHIGLVEQKDIDIDCIKYPTNIYLFEFQIKKGKISILFDPNNCLNYNERPQPEVFK